MIPESPGALPPHPCALKVKTSRFRPIASPLSLGLSGRPPSTLNVRFGLRADLECKSHLDPNVWSGRALHEFFADPADTVLDQCIRPLLGAHRAPGHHGYQRACDLISGEASRKPLAAIRCHDAAHVEIGRDGSARCAASLDAALDVRAQGLSLAGRLRPVDLGLLSASGVYAVDEMGQRWSCGFEISIVDCLLDDLLRGFGQYPGP